MQAGSDGAEGDENAEEGDGEEMGEDLDEGEGDMTEIDEELADAVEQNIESAEPPAAE